MNMTEKIAREESGYERALLDAAKTVIEGGAKLVLITGGSCCGEDDYHEKAVAVYP